MFGKRYVLEFGGAMLAYMLVLVLSLRLLALGVVPDGVRTAVSLAPMLPGLAIAWAVVRQLRRLDELQRKIQLDALGLAFAGTAVLSFGYGFLENVGWPPLSMFVVWPLMAALWCAGTVLATLRYR